MSDEPSSAIVIDTGSGFTKCGISGGFVFVLIDYYGQMMSHGQYSQRSWEGL